MYHTFLFEEKAAIEGGILMSVGGILMSVIVLLLLLLLLLLKVYNTMTSGQ